MSEKQRALEALSRAQWRLALGADRGHDGGLLRLHPARGLDEAPARDRSSSPASASGILLGALVIVSAWVLIWIYVRWANGHYDADRGVPAGARPMTHEPGPAATRRPSSSSSLFVAVTLGITCWAARRTRSTEHFYAAGRSITGLQNGLALAGDYMSAASFLGIAGLVSLSGFDGLIYSIGFLVGWPVVMFLIAEPLRNLGHYTFADVVAFRLRQAPGAHRGRLRHPRRRDLLPDRPDGRGRAT